MILSRVAHSYNSSIWEREVSDQEFKTRLGHRAWTARDPFSQIRKRIIRGPREEEE